MRYDQVDKRPEESLVVTFDFRFKLAEGDSLSGAPTVTVIEGDTEEGDLTIDGEDVGVHASDVTVNSVVIPSGKGAYARIEDGLADKTYTLACTCTTTGGDTLTVVGLVKMV
jgi:hypothetical protein